MNQAIQIDPGTRDALQKMVMLARQGRRDEARGIGKEAVTRVTDTAPIHSLLGRLAGEMGDFPDGIAHLRLALEIAPTDVPTRCDLLASLIQTGALEEALAACDMGRALADPSLQLARFRGYVAQELGQYPDAIIAYRHVVSRTPDDAGTWNNLGNALGAAGDPKGAVEALRQAATLDPQAAPTRLNLAGALIEADQAEEAIETLRRMAADFPRDAKPWVELAKLADRLGQAELALEAYEEAAKREPEDPAIQHGLGNQRNANWDDEGAEQAYRAALAADASYADAYVALAVLYEHRNRANLLPDLVREAEQAQIDPGLLSLVQAYAFRRAKDWQSALDTALAAREDRDPVRRAQIIGESLDRLGRHDEAFEWFQSMNSLVTGTQQNTAGLAATYWAMAEHNRATLTRPWLDGWTPSVPHGEGERPAPAFLLGFPRSGTTLLDTMLMGHPDVQVMEERPPLTHVEHRLGGIDAIPGMDALAVRTARQEYWSEVADNLELRDGTLLIDKSPLYGNKTAIIHRLFPGAKFIMALRHPMDVVLSSYITNFRPNPAMANFLDLRRTAELYDLTMTAFEEARSLLNLPVFTVAYERMVADRDGELRPLFEWLGLDWRDDAVDHQATAAKRGVITTASYAQVHEPLYTRSAGRWVHYAKQLEPVRDLLAPWIEKFGYSLDDPAKVPEREAA